MGEIMAESSRFANSKEWVHLHSQRDKYKKAIDTLKTDGYLPVDIHDSKMIASELYKYASTKKLQRTGNEAPPLIEGAEKLPCVRNLIESRELYEFISLYMGGIAEFHQVRLWWDFPEKSKKSYAAQRWHRDGEDFKVVKLFIYATDVDELSGPHCFLPGSHSAVESKKIFEKDDLDNPNFYGNIYEVDGAMHDQEFKSIKINRPTKKWIGPAGTCFIEDVCGLHCGIPPIKSPRLMLTISWVLGRGKTKRVVTNDGTLYFRKRLSKTK